MSKLSFRNSWLLGAASAAVCMGVAHAQTPVTGPAPAAEEAVADRVTIVGRRPLAESEAASLEIQRESDTIVSVLSADAIGNLPDQNIAFAIGRLPGIGVERDQGQARYINLRGTPNYWSTLSFDGIPIVSPEGRATRFDNIPSALSKQVIVTKSITPDMSGDTVAGNVNIITRSAMDNDGFHINTKAGVGYVTLGGGEEVDLSAVVSNQFLDGKLGVLLQGSYYRRNMVTDNWETDPYLATVDASGVFFAREHENKLYRLTRENQSLSFRTDYEIDDDNAVFWSNVWTNYTDEELRSNYIFRLDQGTSALSTVAYTAATSGNTGLKGTSYGARINQGTNSLESEEDIYTSTLGGEHEVADWDVTWRANMTYTADGRDAPAQPAWQSPSGAADRPSVVYDFSDEEDHQIKLFRTVATGTARALGVRANSIDDFPTTFVSVTRQVGGDETQAYTIKSDAEREFELFGKAFDFKTGFLYTDRLKKSSDQSWTATRAQLVAAGVAVPEITATGPTAAYNALFLSKEFLGEREVPYDFRYHSKTAIEAFALDLQKRGIATRNNTSGNFWKVSEEILAAYAMADVDMDWGNIVFGVRAEQFKNTGKAYGTINGVSQLINSSSDDVLFYPSANVNWNINEEMKLRLGLSTSASRPDFDDLRPNVTINDTTDTISGGNPAATPEKQQGIDLYYEWYMEPEGFLSAGVFYKDISDFLFSEIRTFGSSALDSGGVDRSGYTFTGISNGGDGWLQGFEVFYSQTAQNLVDTTGLPDWLGGFGLRASATFVDSEVDANGRTVNLPGTSDGVYNVQATYEKYDLSVRLAYQFRTTWIQGLGTVNNSAFAGDTYWADDEEIDLSIRYQVNDNLEWFFDAVNLGNQEALRYKGTSLYPIESEQFGERYIMGVRFNY